MNRISDILNSAHRKGPPIVVPDEYRWISEGFTDIPNVLLLDSELSLQARALAGIIILHLMDSNACWPSNELLEEETGIGRSQLAQYKKELIKYGLLIVKRTGRQNVYMMNWGVLNERVSKVILKLSKHVDNKKEN